MIRQIDVRGVLARVGPDRPDLVTRPTGRAVRSSIESELARLTGRTVVVLDFTQVRLIDCSCADEIVAKLVQGTLADQAPLLDAFFLIKGLDEAQTEEMEEVLRRQQLALIAETGGRMRLIGDVAEQARVTFAHIAARQSAAPEELASELAWPLDDVEAALLELMRRRLVLHVAGRYQPPTAAA